MSFDAKNSGRTKKKFSLIAQIGDPLLTLANLLPRRPPPMPGERAPEFAVLGGIGTLFFDLPRHIFVTPASLASQKRLARIASQILTLLLVGFLNRRFNIAPSICPNYETLLS